MDKLLSIIIPSYNMEMYLPKCLGSLIVDDAALLQKLDIIVVNDGSKDRTSDIGHEWEKRFPGVVRVIDKPNGNYGSCINAGLPVASGVFVRVLDADDYQNAAVWQPYLQALAAHADSDVDLFLSLYADVDEVGARLAVSPPFAVPERQTFVPDCFDDRSPRINLHNVTYRTERVRMLGYRQTEGVSYTDTEWITTPMAAVRKAYYVPEAVTCYLTGRAGQTMEKSTYAKKFDVVVRLVAGLCCIYDETLKKASPTAIDLYRRQLMQSVRLVYLALILRNRCFPCTGDLKAFDRTLKEKSPYWYAWADSYVVPSKRFPIRAMHEYHVWHTVHSPQLVVYAAYRWFVRAVQCLRK